MLESPIIKLFGFLAPVTASIISFLNLLNSTLTTISLVIGITIGLITLYRQLFKK